MKRTALAIASLLALAAGTAQAQNVTLYGLVDTGVERLNNIGANGDDLYRMPTLAGSFASRWGMRGSEDLGGGLKAIFTLESGFATDSGIFQQSNRLFGRQLFVGLQGGWGSLTLGRQYSMLLWGSLKSDLMIAQIYGSGAFDLFLAGPRTDNAIVYQGKFGGVSVGALYSFGRDAPAAGGCPGERPSDSEECRGWSAHINYDAASWGVGTWIDEQNGRNASGDTPAGPDFSSRTDRRVNVNGYVMLGKTKIGANYMDRRNESLASPVLEDSTLWSVAVGHPLTAAVTLEAQYYDFDFDDSDNDGNMLVLRGTYAFSKRTATYLTIGHLRNDGLATFSPTVEGQVNPSLRPAPGEKQTGIMVGLRHSF